MTERQLQIWTEIIYEEMDKLEKLITEVDSGTNPTKFGLLTGAKRGLLDALVWLSVVENGKRCKKRIAEIEKRLDIEDEISELN
jgi:hypothetical protein